MKNWQTENVFRVLGTICVIFGFTHNGYGLLAIALYGLYWLTFSLGEERMV